MEKYVTIPFAVNKNQHQANNSKCGTIITAEKRVELLQGYNEYNSKYMILRRVWKIVLAIIIHEIR